jgi:hypothetical protein
MTVPDYISPIIGYRVWKWENTGLKSLCGERWHPSQSLAARCRASAVVGPIVGRAEAVHDAHEVPQTDCTCGVYAAKTFHHLCSVGYAKCGIHGEVYLWGTVVEHELGWRAQFAYSKSLFLPPDLIPSDTKEMESRLKTLAAYDIDIFIGGGRGSIRLCRRGSGFDTAGLDYLIGTRTEYYARRQRDRTLMKGDRVAVLGRGIAVVEQANDKEALVVLGNRLVLKIARKDIILNQQNMRWECEAKNTVVGDDKGSPRRDFLTLVRICSKRSIR